MDGNLTLLLICYLVAMLFGFFFLREKKQERFIPHNSYDELIGILNETINREIKYKHDLDYKIKDVRIIYNFQEDLTEITKRVMTSLSSSFIEELEFYHSKTYVIQYVTRNVEVFLLEYTRQNKIKTK